MIRKIIKFLSILVLCACVNSAHGAASNIPMGDVGDYGVWTTEHNHAELVKTMTADFDNFAPQESVQLVDDFVPIEAKVGLVFMRALSWMNEVLKSSLGRFSMIFIIIAMAFWTLFETYKMMSEGKGAALALGEQVVKKWIAVAIWSAVLVAGPANVFMWVMGPVISIGTYMSDLILGAVTSAAGIELPDTCAAIREYTAAHTSTRMLIDANAAADMMCVPTRLSGFFRTAVAVGWEWVKYGIGHSVLTFIVGVVFIVVFLINIWKYALIALGVIADLFLIVLMLPFTAITETVAKTSYKGIAGTIFNGFLGIFKAQKLDEQIAKFINAAVYFVSLSMVIALCAALLSGTITTNLASDTPSINTLGFMPALLTGLLTWHLANRATEIAKNLGGSINDSFGQKFGADVKGLWDATNKKAKEWIKIIRES